MILRNAKSLTTFLSETDAETPVVARVRRHAQLQKKYVEALNGVGRGDLVAHTRVAAMDGTTLVVAAANAACAAILKQMLPQIKLKLIENFRQENDRKSENQTQEQELTAIRVVLQPDPAAWKPPPARAPRVLIRGAMMDDSSLANLTSTLSDSPLKSSLAKMQQKRKQALTNKN